MEAKVTEVRQNFAAYLVQVQAGEEITLTQHGRPVAKLVPATDEKARKKAEAEAYLAKLRETVVLGDIESPLDVEWDAEHGRM
jgi:prevent-host-death family protein